MTRPCVNLKEHSGRSSCSQNAVLAHPERLAPPQGQLSNTKIEQGLQAVQEQHSEAGPAESGHIHQRGQRRTLRQKGQDRSGPAGDTGEKS